MRQSLVALAVAFAASALLAAQARPGRVLLNHEFTTSTEGWRIAGDVGPEEAVFHATGGHPGGYIAGIDDALGETWFFHAPDALLAQLPAAIGGSLSFSLKQSGMFISLIDDDVVIVGPAGRITHRFPLGPGTVWTDFSVEFTERAGWTWNFSQRATQAQIDSVLRAATRLEIRGEYVTGDDEGSLDNVVLRAAPE